MNSFYYKLILFLLFFSTCAHAQENEKYQISVMKFTKTVNGVNLPIKEIIVDTLGIVRNNQNEDVFKINLDSLSKSIQAFLSDDLIKEYKSDTYQKRNVFVDINPGETLNISISKASDLVKEKEIKNKTYYHYNKSFPYKENEFIVYEFEKYFNDIESKKLIKLLYQL